MGISFVAEFETRDDTDSSVQFKTVSRAAAWDYLESSYGEKVVRSLMTAQAYAARLVDEDAARWKEFDSIR